MGTRLRVLWLALLLALAPGGPGSLLLTGHSPGDAAHTAGTLVHDASDHGIDAGPVGNTAAERHCFYCQTASSVRFGSVHADTRLAAPLPVLVDWPDSAAAALLSRLRQALPARAPPRTA